MSFGGSRSCSFSFDTLCLDSGRDTRPDHGTLDVMFWVEVEQHITLMRSFLVLDCMAMQWGILNTTLVFGGKSGKTDICRVWWNFWLRSPEREGTCGKFSEVLVQHTTWISGIIVLVKHRRGVCPWRKEGGSGSGSFIHGRSDSHFQFPWTVRLFLEKQDKRQRRHSGQCVLF